jgi:hypothetical protein
VTIQAKPGIKFVDVEANLSNAEAKFVAKNVAL